MMKTRSRARILSALLALAMIFTMLPTAWAAEGPDGPSPQDDKPLQNISLNESNYTLDIGKSVTLTVTYNPDDTTDSKQVQWSTSPDSSEYLTVTPQGENDASATVEAKKASSTPITVTATVGGKSASCSITIRDPEPEIKVESITISGNQDLKVGESCTLSATVNYSSGSGNNQVTWSASPSGIVTLDGAKVTAQSVGEVTITATSTEDPKITKDCTIKVSEPVPVEKPVESVTIPSTLSLTVGQESTLTPVIIPSEAKPKSIVWASNASTIASVDPSSGKITAKAAGIATVTVTIDGKVSNPCTVTVNQGNVPVTGVTVSPTSGTVGINGTLQLTATVQPTNATNKAVTWKSLHENIATVDQNGKVTGKAVGTATIQVTTADGGKTANCTVTVTQGTVAVINYSVALDKTLTLNPSDFYNVCTGVYGNALDYVKFDQNSSKGTLYFGYTENGGAKISTSNAYSYSNNASKPISRITFVPDGNSGDTATFTYTGWDSAGKTYNGTVQIKLTAPSGDISYETGKNESITFKDSDFNDMCKKITGSSLDYVTFGSVSSSKGTLYLDYGGKNEDKLSTSTKCYYNDSPYLSNVTFVPAKDYTGTFTISYTGRSNARDTFSGSVKITVRKSGTTISYTVAGGKTVTLDDSDFNNYCKDETGYNMDYVQLTPPSSSKGIFYYRYGESRYEKEISSSDKYYRSSSPKLDDVTFVPKSSYSGVVSVSFTGLSTNGDKFSGTLKIRVGDASVETIPYTVDSGTSVSFRASDFNDYCKNATEYSLDYVRFTPPSSSKGVLYYQRGQSGEKTVNSNTSYYRSAVPKLDDLSFVPASNFTGTVEIPFTGRSTDGDSISGTVVITCNAPKEAALIRYSTGSTPVTFQVNDFISACATRGGGFLVSVRFNSPVSNTGKLYYGYESPSKYGGQVSSSISFATSGSSSISNVTFVPKSSYIGTTTITYTGTDSTGSTFNGQVIISITPSTTSQYFSDMGSHSWAAASVDFLYAGGVTTGTSATAYGPSLSITRGDFVLMLYRAFNLTANTTDGFKDVPSNSYYAQAIAVAKALGIAQGSDDGRFNPTAPLTREDAMVFLYRTLNRTGRTVASASASYLNRFSDGSSTSSYAQDSVAALAQAGIIQGDTNSRLNPKSSLTRAEMAVILHRVLTL